jgi:hypothetical protein
MVGAPHLRPPSCSKSRESPLFFQYRTCRMRGSDSTQVRAAHPVEAHAVTREVCESLPRVPDVFQNWENWELQRRRYQRTGQLPVSAD